MCACVLHVSANDIFAIFSPVCFVNATMPSWMRSKLYRKMGFISKDYVWLAINQVAEPLLNENSNLLPTDLNGLFMFDNLLKLHGYPPYERFLDKWAALDPSE